MLSDAEFVLFGGHGGAAEGTLISETWARFAQASDQVSGGSAVAVAGLARGLGVAGQAYQMADDSVADAVEG